MQSSRTRLICRAHNRFTPSIVLWQHFVAPNPPILNNQQRLSSSATGTTGASQGRATDNGLTLDPHETSSLQQFESEIAASEDITLRPAPTIRKTPTARGHWFETKVEASIAKNVRTKYDSRQASLNASEELLASARAAFELSSDYEGIVVQPMASRKAIKESSLPWCLKDEERTMSGIDRLAIEIERFYEFARPTRYENVARKHVIKQVQSHVRQFLPDHVLEVFGSERTGIPLAMSDIDFRLIWRSRVTDPAQAKLPPTRSERSEAMKDLRELYWTNLRRHKAYLLPKLRYARYPLISMQDRQSGLDVQIVLSNDTSISRVIMHDYMEQYPYLRPVYYVVKTMFDVRGLSDVFRGGFGSYSLFMMIVASVRHKPNPRNDTAGALINFLSFWRDFDTRKQGISIEPPEFFDKDSDLFITDEVKSKIKAGTVNDLPSYMLSLRDPADETNNLGRRGIAIKHVQATFSLLLRRLRADMKANQRPSLLCPLVGHSYMLDYERRGRLQDYGRKVMRQTQAGLAVKAKAIRDAEDKETTEKEAMDKETMGMAVEQEMKEEEETLRLAREERDREWQRLAKARDERLRLKAESLSLLEHGEATANILDIPAVEEDASTKTMGAQDEGQSRPNQPAEVTIESKSS
ncbi:uncharacterized protein K460DRAFT_375402 [Cucurbitaria berberidis CBS 394.84]|uniref:Poly(A) RNA polymerase mitochondrial-like central palm domain-containing protein n=1 Tax=Cucurbitaria berberidis CBS 394.84 TaxID=1168544 RepID=A0A9P4LB04_9PLEO|nr:uncharacterized protein K460DRAFT_375402 [Cucurbitaria berberidis CBS 394.84]KAF1848555.1 hypothetical protein K460DRAFT_375402 [Cucurbitaria berberidis CBS 394.84]